MAARRKNRRALAGGLCLLALLPAAFALACGGGSAPQPTPTPLPGATPPAATPTATGTAAPAWWEEDSESPTPPGPPESRVWNVVVQPADDGEVSISFDYHLDIAPEANVFVHQGLLPDVSVALLDANGVAIGRVGGALDPTEFGDDTVGGQATFTVLTSRFDDVEAAHFCIRVVTGNYDDFVGRTEAFCEPVPVEKVSPE